MKVMTVVGTRPEVIRLSRVIAQLDGYTDHILVHTGQNYDYELNEIFFRELEIRKPNYFLQAAGSTAAETIGQTIIRIDPILEKERPDALLVLGDTNSCLAVIPAKRRKIPIFHMEAGNRCFDQRVPEETNRRIVDHVSDVNMPYSGIAREYLLREGVCPDRIIKTGSPMYEVLEYYKGRIENSNILDRLGLKPFEFFLVSAHREENIESEAHFQCLIELLNVLAEKFNTAVIVSTHPRTRNKTQISGVRLHRQIELLKPLGFLDYIKLQENAKVVLSDSGTITEESSILNFPAINLRDAHERPEGMEEAAVIMTGLDVERVLQALELVTVQQPKRSQRRFSMVPDYQVANVSEKVLRIIVSYVNYVKRTVWFDPAHTSW